MMIRFLQLLLLLLVGSDRHEPTYDLRKRKEPVTLQGLNWTFILLTLAIVLFFVFIWAFQFGNPYPNDLMSGNLNV